MTYRYAWADRENPRNASGNLSGSSHIVRSARFEPASVWLTVQARITAARQGKRSAEPKGCCGTFGISSYPYYRECVQASRGSSRVHQLSIHPVPRYGPESLHRELYDLLNAQRSSFVDQQYAPAIHAESLPFRSRLPDSVSRIGTTLTSCHRRDCAAILLASHNSPDRNRFRQFHEIARRAIRNHGLRRVTSIDPFPRAQIDELADTVIRRLLGKSTWSSSTNCSLATSCPSTVRTVRS
jgi:hypothetical protein